MSILLRMFADFFGPVFRVLTIYETLKQFIRSSTAELCFRLWPNKLQDKQSNFRVKPSLTILADAEMRIWSDKALS